MDWTVSLKDSSKSSTSIPVNMTLFGNGVSANAAKLRILNDIILNLRWVLSSIAISLQGKRRKREKERVPGGSVVKSQSEIQEMQEMRVWSLGRGNGNPLQYSCLENSMDRGAWWATICGITSQTQLSTCTRTHTHTHTSSDTDARKAVWRQRQRLEWWSHKPRDAWSHLKLDRARKEPKAL